ncbi:hypothetical protein HW35_13455 [Bacillus sp. X1(2014)]|jgi:signal transduction histidine kinase|nr:hypothetical protein HW35_13455 [Bacillus sp. X1(2014)]
MKSESIIGKLLFEERRANTLFLWLFYILFLVFDLLWYIVLPRFSRFGDKEFLQTGLGYCVFVFMFILLVFTYKLNKNGNPYKVKYILFISYILIDVTDNVLRYFGTTLQFAAGNIVELLFVFMSPIFVNKRYFWTVSLGVIGKYILLGIILHTADVLAPIIILSVLAAIAFILLKRFNSYVNSLTSVHEELRQKERLAIIGQMSAAIGHEIRNPMASLKGFIQLQREQYPNTNDYYSIMIQEIDRIDSIIDDLLYIGKPRVIQFNKGNIKEIIDYTISLVKQQDEENRIVFETKIEDTIPEIDCVEKRLKQVLINLIKNAIEAMPKGGRITISAGVLDRTKVWLSIEDEGDGIKEENIANISVPFFTTKKNGTGLGLMVSEQIIKDHNGSIKFESTEKKGTKVIVELPIVQNNKKIIQ